MGDLEGQAENGQVTVRFAGGRACINQQEFVCLRECLAKTSQCSYAVLPGPEIMSHQQTGDHIDIREQLVGVKLGNVSLNQIDPPGQIEISDGFPSEAKRFCRDINTDAASVSASHQPAKSLSATTP
jgi:hypothetical protein